MQHTVAMAWLQSPICEAMAVGALITNHTGTPCAPSSEHENGALAACCVRRPRQLVCYSMSWCVYIYIYIYNVYIYMFIHTQVYVYICIYVVRVCIPRYYTVPTALGGQPAAGIELGLIHVEDRQPFPKLVTHSLRRVVTAGLSVKAGRSRSPSCRAG